jgi:hypothetical protein
MSAPHAAHPTEHNQEAQTMNNAELFAQTGRHPAFAECAANLTDLLRGLMIRWETLDFTATANCLDLDARMQAWQDVGADELLPRGYQRQ